MDVFKSFLLQRLTLRCIYIFGAYSASHAIAFVSQDKVSTFLHNSGVSLTITDPDKVKGAIVTALLIGGEFLFHFFHKNVVMPQVEKAALTNPEVKQP